MNLDGNNITNIIIAAIGLAGIIYQAYCSKSNRQHTEKTVGVTKEELKQKLEVIEDKEEELHTCMAVNNRVTIANARSAIKRFHDMHSQEKKVTYSDLEMLEEIYSAYKKMRFEDGHVPNGYADRCIEEIRQWEIVEDGFPYATSVIADEPKKDYNKKVKTTAKKGKNGRNN